MFERIKGVFSRLLKKELIVAEDGSLLDKAFIVREINKFKASETYRDMINGENYFKGAHDILKRQRTIIGDSGQLQVVSNLPNNRIVDNQYRKMVNQKNNYLLGKPISFVTANEIYLGELNKVFNMRFNRTLKNIGEDCLNCGIGYLYISYDAKGNMKFTRLKPYEVIPIWVDSEHEKLEMVIRVYQVNKNIGISDEVIEKVEVYSYAGIDYFTYNSGHLKPTEPYHTDYFSINGEGFNWSVIPIIPFKYNSGEIPLIKMAKSLQDGINTILSNFQNNMEEDMRNTIMVLVNYDGENLGEFRRNLATFGAVKITNNDGNPGDVRTLQIEVNSENYRAILELFKKAIIENCMGYDAKDDRLSGNANQLNIQSMYSDIDLDANSMETEYQASFEDLLWFVNIQLYNSGVGDFENEKLEVIFNRDMLMNESEIIDNLNKSTGILSKKTIIAQHPWVNDVEEEQQRIDEEQEDSINQYNNAFKKVGGANGEEQ